MKTFPFIFYSSPLLLGVGGEIEEAILSHLILFTCEEKKESNGGESKRLSPPPPPSLFIFWTFPARQNKLSWRKSFPWLSVKKPGFSTDPISSSCAVTICAESCTQGLETKPARPCKAPWFRLAGLSWGSLQNLSLMRGRSASVSPRRLFVHAVGGWEEGVGGHSPRRFNSTMTISIPAVRPRRIRPLPANWVNFCII